MPRNNDGTVTLNRNFIIDDANNTTFTGSKLQENFADLADISTNSLDIQGTTKMQANLDMANNSIINLKNAENTTDAANVNTMLQFQQGVPCAENGSSAGLGLIKLTSQLQGLSSLFYGFVIRFTAPFTMTPEAMKSVKRYEVIELTIGSGTTVEIPVLRAPYTEVDADLYEDDIKDNRPSFIEGNSYTLMYNGNTWVSLDYNISGTLLIFLNNNYTPAGYKDLSYNYDGQDYQKYPFLRAYNPRKDLPDADPTYENKFKFLAGNLAMLPEHGHVGPGVQNNQSTQNRDYTPQSSVVDFNITLSPEAEKNVQVGDDLYPSNISIRLLQKI